MNFNLTEKQNKNIEVYRALNNIGNILIPKVKINLGRLSLI